MTREEVQQILSVLDVTYSNFKVENPTMMINAWHLFLADFDYQQIQQALKTFVLSGQGKGFAPSVDQLIAMTRKPIELSVMGEAEAWSLVSKAIRRSSYYSEQEFAKLPPYVQRAVGSANQLRSWAIDDDFNESVISSNFKRSYRAVVDREMQIMSLPPEARAKLELISQLALGVNRDE